MKKAKHLYLSALLVCLFNNQVKAQILFGTAPDSLKKYQLLYTKLKDDNSLFGLYISKGYIFRRRNPDSEFYYGHLALKLAKKTSNKYQETIALDVLQYYQWEEGNLAEALNLQLQMLELAKELNLVGLEGQALNSIGNTYLDMGALRNSLSYYRKSLAAFNRKKATYWQLNERSNIGNTFEKLNMADSALFYEHDLYHDRGFPIDLTPELLDRIGNANVKLGKYNDALSYYKKGLNYATTIKTINDVAIINYHIAKLYLELNRPDSAYQYANSALKVSKPISLSDVVLKSSRLLAQIFDRQGKIDSAYRYQQIATRYNQILFGAEKFNRIQQILSSEQQRQQKLLQEQEQLKNRYRIIGGLSILLFLLTIAFLIWRNNLAQRKKNKLLDAQKTQLIDQRDELQNTLAKLKQTQQHLIQSEKMASLGELTAGIAHEIQNPLNFVNNFSEVSVELLEELKEEAQAGNTEDVLALADDLTQNLSKINHHGKRADSIVKGMLEHSRIGSGVKEPTNLNKLADEYLRLAYHGLRAKDKSFNAELVTNFDESLPLISVVPQDIGRVLLNLFNNAFYAVQQKAKTAGPDYKPEVSVETFFLPLQKVGGFRARDNGTGIPNAIKDKIMQPFFTTKPTGEGTGLGLSLTYDMVIKGHGGSIEVNSKEGEYSAFTIRLPLS